MTPSRMIHTHFRPAGKFCRLLALVGLLVATGAASTRAEVKAVTDWVPVSVTAGEIYVINDIKPGTTPTFKVEDNPQAFVSYNSPPGKLTMLSAAAGRWIVTVTNTSDREISYDLNAFAAAKAGAPPDSRHGAALNQRRGSRRTLGRRGSLDLDAACERCSGRLLVAPAIDVDGSGVQRDNPRQGAAVRRCILEYAAAPGRSSARLPPGAVDRATRAASGRVSKRSVGVG